MSKVKTSVSIDTVVYEKLKEISEKEERSFSQQLNKIIKEYLEKVEK